MGSEKAVANKLVKAALGAGYLVSVNDGGAWPVKLSKSFQVISDALASSDQDTLRFRDASGNHVGDVLLVWGNSAEELICDHSDNAAISALVEQAEA
jgi:hypothetical protein